MLQSLRVLKQGANGCSRFLIYTPKIFDFAAFFKHVYLVYSYIAGSCRCEAQVEKYSIESSETETSHATTAGIWLKLTGNF